VPLQAEAAESLRALAIVWEDTVWPWYGNLLHGVRNGDVPFQHVQGMGLFAYLQHHPQAGEVFKEAMTNLTRPYAAVVLAADDLAGIATLADVGGGNGSLITAILTEDPHMRGILIEGCALARERGLDTVCVPAIDAREVTLLGGATVVPAWTFGALAACHQSQLPWFPDFHPCR
jgi:hypothetical protein